MGSTVGAQPQADLRRAVRDAQAGSGLPVVFAGRTVDENLRISVLRGNQSDALLDLRLGANIGLGGRAVALGRPVSVRDYLSARAISHEHDRAVADEGLRALVAVPVIAGHKVGAVLYGGVRSPVDLGDSVVSSLVAAGRQLACEIEAEENRRQWVGSLAGSDTLARLSAPARRSELRHLLEELRVAVDVVPDHYTRSRLLCLCGRLLAAMEGRHSAASMPTLSPRERDVLLLVSAGCSNAEIDDALGITSEAVKSHVRSLRRKFGVHSRLAVVSAARSHGLLS